MALTPQQRAAQRTLIGIVRNGRLAGLHKEQHLAIWRERGCEEWMCGAEELSAHLTVLKIPHTTVPATRSVAHAKRPRVGVELRVAWDDLDTVLRWMPSFQKLIDAVNQ